MFEVLYTTATALAPFTPFLTEYFYQHLRKLLPENEREDSVHYLEFPKVVEAALNPRIEEAVNRMQAVIQLGRAARDRRTLPLKFPLTKVTSINSNSQFQADIESLKTYIIEELNVKEVVLTNDESQILTSAKPDLPTLGKRLKKDFAKVSKAIQALSHEQIKSFQESGKLEIEGHVITSEELLIVREFKGDAKKFEAAWDSEALIVLDLEVDEEMRQEGIAREVINRIQRLRKKAGIHPSDPIEVFYEVDAQDSLAKVIENQRSFIVRGVGVPFTPLSARPATSVKIMQETAEVLGSKITLNISVLTVGFCDSALKQLVGAQDSTFVEDLKFFFVTRDYNRLVAAFEHNNGKYQLTLNGVSLEVEWNKHIFRSVHDSQTHSH
jgi:isoleucyl-tRNA synthetase